MVPPWISPIGTTRMARPTLLTFSVGRISPVLIQKRRIPPGLKIPYTGSENYSKTVCVDTRSGMSTDCGVFGIVAS